MTTTQTFLVVWRDDGEHLQSSVDIGITDPHQMTNNDWVVAAARSEGWSDEDAAALVEQGYELLLVCDFPARFFDT